MPKSSNYAGKTNRLPSTNASSKLGKGRSREKQQTAAKNSNRRSAETIQRLKMYTSGKPIRNRQGQVVAGAFQMSDRAGDRVINGGAGRIAPDRRWFGNTRVIGATDLDRFRQEMTQQMADPYSVVLKRKKVPMGLLQDVAEQQAAAGKGLLEQEPFEQAFGKQSRRKRVKLDQYMVSRSVEQQQQLSEKKKNKTEATAKVAKVDGSAEPVAEQPACGYAALLQTAQKSQESYQEINAREGIVPWGRDKDVVQKEGEGIDWRHEKKDDLFLKGQSKRIWGEFFKVVDCSDVILHVIDARNVPGTRCTMIENHIAKNAPHKHLVFILNKIDLVPNWVAKRWMGELAKARPTIAFHASLTHAFGKGALISLLRQFGKLHEDKKEISVGVIGYPNVGKSSVINTLISKKSCKVAPVPGETKIWQYVTLFKRISLIDCPGVVVDTAGDSETDSVLKGVVRAERLEHPEDFVEAIMKEVKREHIAAQYKIEKDCWEDSTTLLENIAKKFGRLRKGGDPCLRSAAIMLINDFQRGRLPHYVSPPELKEDEASLTGTRADADVKIRQDLNVIGSENMHNENITEETENEGSPAEQSDVSKETAKAEEEEKFELKTSEEEADDAGPSRQATEDLIGDGDWDD